MGKRYDLAADVEQTRHFAPVAPIHLFRRSQLRFEPRPHHSITTHVDTARYKLGPGREVNIGAVGYHGKAPGA